MKTAEKQQCRWQERARVDFILTAVFQPRFQSPSASSDATLHAISHVKKNLRYRALFQASYVNLDNAN